MHSLNPWEMKINGDFGVGFMRLRTFPETFSIRYNFLSFRYQHTTNSQNHRIILDGKDL